jgi:two-component system, OmpR family, sensor histidine kinase CiaH
LKKSKKIRLVFFTYWFLLVYIVAALVWWYIAISRQHDQVVDLKMRSLNASGNDYETQVLKLEDERKRKTAQYAGEGLIFLLLIGAGAIYVYRAVNRELKLNREQQHFIMAITHELKTPIAIAKLNLETLQMRKLDEAQQQRLLYNTLQETNRLNTLCNNMLISSQIEAGGYRLTPEEINISSLVQKCADDFKTRFPQRTFTTNVVPDIFANGDMLLLQMAVNNLLDNAIKYSPKDLPILVNVKQDQERVLVSVSDEGAGIEESEKLRVFDKFHRTGNEATKQAKGTGLGLYLTKRIVEQHKGQVYIRDNMPKGSIFTIELKQAL